VFGETIGLRQRLQLNREIESLLIKDFLFSFQRALCKKIAFLPHQSFSGGP